VTNAFGDPPALQVRQQNFDRSGSIQASISNVFGLLRQTFSAVQEVSSAGIGIVVDIGFLLPMPDCDCGSDADSCLSSRFERFRG
jgi:hypothetical protein